MANDVEVNVERQGEKLKVTSIVVTHDMQSVRKVADRVVMLHTGQIIFSGTPQDLDTTDHPVVKQFVNAEADGPIQPKLINH